MPEYSVPLDVIDLDETYEDCHWWLVTSETERKTRGITWFDFRPLAVMFEALIYYDKRFALHGKFSARLATSDDLHLVTGSNAIWYGPSKEFSMP